MTAGEQLEERGRLLGVEQGFQQGLQQGVRKALLKLLRARFGELPAAAIARIDAASTDQLDVWADRMITAATLDQVLAGE